MMKCEHSKTLIVLSDINDRRLDFAIAYLTGLSRKESRRVVENGRVLLNGTKETFPSKRVNTGDRISILQFGFTEEHKPVIIYKDDLIIVVNKPAGILTMRQEYESGRTLADMLEKMGKIVFPVHRLDRDTSGLIVFARTQQSRDFLVEEFRRRRVNKRYIGVVEGLLKHTEGAIKGKIGKTGEFAETYYRVLKKLKNATVVEFIPRTGRTHQLRLQFFEIGHPIVGDKKYYRKKSTIIFPRHALHSHRLTFLHPGTKRWVRFTAPLPDDMRQLINNLAG